MLDVTIRINNVRYFDENKGEGNSKNGDPSNSKISGVRVQVDGESDECG